MDPNIERLLREKHPEISAACRRHGVTSLCLFGSAVVGAFDVDSSDVDLVVSFDEAGRQKAFDNFFGLSEDLHEIFGREVDLLTDRSVGNAFLRESIDRHRVVIYDAHASETAG